MVYRISCNWVTDYQEPKLVQYLHHFFFALGYVSLYHGAKHLIQLAFLYIKYT